MSLRLSHLPTYLHITWIDKESLPEVLRCGDDGLDVGDVGVLGAGEQGLEDTVESLAQLLQTLFAKERSQSRACEEAGMYLAVDRRATFHRI